MSRRAILDFDEPITFLEPDASCSRLRGDFEPDGSPAILRDRNFVIGIAGNQHEVSSVDRLAGAERVQLDAGSLLPCHGQQPTIGDCYIVLEGMACLRARDWLPAVFLFDGFRRKLLCARLTGVPHGEANPGPLYGILAEGRAETQGQCHGNSKDRGNLKHAPT